MLPEKASDDERGELLEVDPMPDETFGQ